MLPHERLDAWQACHELWIAVFKSTLKWPASEKYVLVTQIKRAALSSSANIAEGVAKRGPRDYARHLNIAIGSLAEVASLLRSAKDVDVIDGAEFDRLFQVQQKASRVTMFLYKAVRRACDQPS
jgi:four helix bundle protein